MNRDGRFPWGIRAIIAFHLLNLLLWSVGQTGALLDYDRVADWGLQDARFLVDPVIVQVNQGIALADTIVMLPLFALAVIGILMRRYFGLVASWLALGITVYWPVVFWSSQSFYSQAGTRHVPIAPATVIVPAAFLVTGGWAGWYLARHRALFK